MPSPTRAKTWAKRRSTSCGLGQGAGPQRLLHGQGPDGAGRSSASDLRWSGHGLRATSELERHRGHATARTAAGRPPIRGLASVPGGDDAGRRWSPCLTHPVVTLAPWSSEWSSDSPSGSPPGSPGTWCAAPASRARHGVTESRLADAQAAAGRASRPRLRRGVGRRPAAAETARAVAPLRARAACCATGRRGVGAGRGGARPPGRGVRRALGRGPGPEQRAVPRLSPTRGSTRRARRPRAT